MKQTQSGTRTSRRHRPGVNRIVLTLLRSPMHGLVSRGLCELRYRAPRSGRLVCLPVGYAADGERIVVLAGFAADKRWWRAFARPYPLEIRRGGTLRRAVGHVVRPDDPAAVAAAAAYRVNHRVTIHPTDRLLLIDERADSEL
jgi:hypothetical protein